MDNTCFDLYKRLTDNEELFRDEKVFRFYFWLLTHADKSTGEKTITRSFGAELLGCSPDGFYHVLQRGINKFKLFTANGNNKRTAIRLLHQDKLTPFGFKRTTKEQQKNNQAQEQKEIPPITPKEKPTQEKKDKRKEIPSKVSADVLGNILETWNAVHNTHYTSTVGFAANATFWLTQYALEDIKQAIKAIKDHGFWKSRKVDPTWLFRRKNPQGETVDYIGVLLNGAVKNTAAANTVSFNGVSYPMYMGPGTEFAK